MKAFRLCTIFIFCMCFNAHAEDGFRLLRNDAGQTIKARPVGVYGDQVRIELEDLRQMNVTLDLFVIADAEYLKEWAISYLAKSGRLLDIEVNRKEVKVSEFTKDVSLTGGGVAKDALEIEEFDGYYEIEVENLSDFKIDGLRVEYRIFSQQDKTAPIKRDDVRYLRESGEISYTLMPRKPVMQKTNAIKMRETKLGKGITWTSGGDIESKAKMIGVWAKFYYKDVEVLEYALPSVLPEREKWIVKKADPFKKK